MCQKQLVSQKRRAKEHLCKRQNKKELESITLSLIVRNMLQDMILICAFTENGNIWKDWTQKIDLAVMIKGWTGLLTRSTCTTNNAPKES